MSPKIRRSGVSSLRFHNITLRSSRARTVVTPPPLVVRLADAAAALRTDEGWQRLGIVALYLCVVVIATLQRGVFDHSHTTFPIFRNSFYHLMSGQNLYAGYPAEQGGRPQDLFKYTPTAALFFGLIALPVPWLGLLLWNLINAGILVLAINRLLPLRTATVALALVFPAALSALQSSSSNALVAGLMVLGFVALEEGRRVGASAAIALGAFIKIFPIATVLCATPLPRRARFAGALVITSVVLLATPLLATPLPTLAAQYHWWWKQLMTDSADLQFGLSIMRILRTLCGIDMPNWPLQLAGTVALAAPLVACPGRWTDAQLRRLFLSSLLIYAVLFNHQAEHQSYVIASVGMALWYLSYEKTMWRTTLVVLCVVGLDTIPYALVWLTIQTDLWRRLADHAVDRERATSLPVTVFRD